VAMSASNKIALVISMIELRVCDRFCLGSVYFSVCQFLFCLVLFKTNGKKLTI